MIPIRSFGYREKSRSFFRYPPVARNVSRSVRTFRARRWRSYEASPAIEKSPRARASTAARAAAIPEAIARSTPRNVYPLLIRNPAASPTRSTPSPIYRDFIPSPSSGTRWAEYSETFPPLISRWTLGWRRNFSITTWTSTFLRARSSEETTSPREREALFVYRNPPPRRPMLASPAYTIAAPSFSPTLNRSWIVAAGSSTVSFTPTETLSGFRSARSPAFRARGPIAPSAITTTSDWILSGPAMTPRTRPPSNRRSSTLIPVISIAPAASAFFASHSSNLGRRAVKLDARSVGPWGFSY